MTVLRWNFGAARRFVCRRSAIVAIVGTTISPYLFFWQTSQEVEEIDGKDEAHPLRETPR